MAKLKSIKSVAEFNKGLAELQLQTTRELLNATSKLLEEAEDRNRELQAALVKMVRRFV